MCSLHCSLSLSNRSYKVNETYLDLTNLYKVYVASFTGSLYFEITDKYQNITRKCLEY